MHKVDGAGPPPSPLPLATLTKHLLLVAGVGPAVDAAAEVGGLVHVEPQAIKRHLVIVSKYHNKSRFASS